MFCYFTQWFVENRVILQSILCLLVHKCMNCCKKDETIEEGCFCIQNKLCILYRKLKPPVHFQCIRSVPLSSLRQLRHRNLFPNLSEKLSITLSSNTCNFILLARSKQQIAISTCFSWDGHYKVLLMTGVKKIKYAWRRIKTKQS